MAGLFLDLPMFSEKLELSIAYEPASVYEKQYLSIQATLP